MQRNAAMMMTDRMAGHVRVTARRLRMIGVVDFGANLVDIEHFARVNRAMTAGVRHCGHDNNAEKQPNQNQE